MCRLYLDGDRIKMFTRQAYKTSAFLFSLLSIVSIRVKSDIVKLSLQFLNCVLNSFNSLLAFLGNIYTSHYKNYLI